MSIGSQFLLSAPGGFGPNPKKSPNTSFTFCYFSFLRLAILAEVGYSPILGDGEIWFMSSESFL